MTTYNGLETAVDTGKPVFLYEIQYDDASGLAYRYASTTDTFVALGKTWTGFPIKHNEIVASGTLDKQTLTMTARKDIELAQLFILSPPSYVVTLKIWRGYPDEQQYTLEWNGRITNVSWKDAEVEFTAEPISTTMRNTGLRRKYQLLCPHVLYGDMCQASKLANSETGQITALLNATTVQVVMTSAEMGVTPGNLVGGMVEVVLATGRKVRRSIIWSDQVASRTFRVQMMSYLSDLEPGLTITLTKGCNHTFAQCRDTFANVSNFGGCPNIPTTNPYKNNTF